MSAEKIKRLNESAKKNTDGADGAVVAGVAREFGVAVIGCGTIARAAHIPSYLNNGGAKLLYLCDIVPEKAKDAAKDFSSDARVISDYREALNDDRVDAVSVCVPNYAHAEISIAALRAGKSVLCEKPAARTYAEAVSMQKAALETGGTLCIGVVNRYNNGVNRIKDMIAAGELGNVYHAHASFRAHRSIPGLGGMFTTKAASGGGVLIDWGVHYLDIVMYCLGDPKPTAVSAETFCKLGRDIPGYAYKDMWAGPPALDGVYDVDDSVVGLVRTGGPVISLHGAWAQNIGVSETYIDFMGDKAGVRLQYGKDFTVYSSGGGALLETKVSYSSGDMFQKEIDSFIEAARTGEKAPSDIDAAIVTSKLMQAIYDSAQSRSEVKLES